ncbi:hypothetical protein B0H15DRAFT_806226 [Mycena belliarum]|uniref:Uncharacterized protein n=1 Tax=Mycena belliarum TaxID=1033014 RepID=A0AAD6TUF7_9AGAR|nr:hypothetical protein B0H15DRAFT_806226 [Mycena belliae]
MSSSPVRVAAKRRRTRKTGKKPGKASWVSGTKLAFFERYKERWQSMGDHPGRFYSEMAKRFLLKYGWDSSYGERGFDLDEDTEDPTDEELEAFVSPEDEVEERMEYYYNLRTKIGQWLPVSSQETAFQSVSGGEPPSWPGAALILKTYYDKRVKDAFTKEFERLTKDWEAGELDSEPKEIATRNRMTRECYAAESDAFRERIEAKVEKIHKEAMAEWDESQDVLEGGGDARTPEEYHELLTTAAATIDPLAAGLAARYGMVCSIFIAGPVPGKGGMIEVMSSNAGTTLGKSPKRWPEFDGPGASNVWVSNATSSSAGPRTLTSGVFAGLGRGNGLSGWGSEEDEDDAEEEEEEEEEEEALATQSRRRKGTKGGEKEKEKRKKGAEKGKGKGKKGAGMGRGSAAKKAKAAALGPQPAGPRPQPKPKGSADSGGGDSGGGDARRFDSGGADSGGGDSGSGGGNSGGLRAAATRAGLTAATRAVLTPGPATQAALTRAAAAATPGASTRAGAAGSGGGDSGAALTRAELMVVTGATLTSNAANSDGGRFDSGSADSGGGDARRINPWGAKRASERLDLGSADLGGGEAEPINSSHDGTDGSLGGRMDSGVPSSDDADDTSADTSAAGADADDTSAAGADSDNEGPALNRNTDFRGSFRLPYERLRMAKPPRAGLGVDNWIASGRRLWAPCLPAPSELRERFWTWWRGMQPKVRHIGDGVMSRGADIDWSVLRDFSGKNGLLQVMMVLLWWGEKVHAEGGPEGIAEWTLAVEDVTWVFIAMVKEGRLSKKRASERGVTDKPPPPPAKKARWSM